MEVKLISPYANQSGRVGVEVMLAAQYSIRKCCYRCYHQAGRVELALVLQADVNIETLRRDGAMGCTAVAQG